MRWVTAQPSPEPHTTSPTFNSTSPAAATGGTSWQHSPLRCWAQATAALDGLPFTAPAPLSPWENPTAAGEQGSSRFLWYRGGVRRRSRSFLPPRRSSLRCSEAMPAAEVRESAVPGAATSPYSPSRRSRGLGRKRRAVPGAELWW